jgi:hypothetical protein
MSKVKIKLALLGHIPLSLDINKLLNWKSDLFEIIKPLNTYTITTDSDGPEWEFTDENIQEQLPTDFDADILIAITNVPIENNYFARRYPGNKICLSYYEMNDILLAKNIPIENLALRVMYTSSFVYRRYGNRIPLMTEKTNFSHDETKGCIFDMNGIKENAIYSTNKPILCNSCEQALTNARIPKNIIDSTKEEIKKIRKRLYYRIADFIKVNPIWTIIISSITALVLGIIGSLIASGIWEKIVRQWLD